MLVNMMLMYAIPMSWYIFKCFVVQLYVPPDTMINKDFLRKILVEEKKLLTLAEKREINVPRYDELSVNTLYPKFKDDARFMAYFPD